MKKEKNRKKREKNQRRFDSTLGFPGEGPERLRMATFNVRGLKGKEDGIHKMRNLLKWAHKNSLDVLFIQEHNGNRVKVNEWKAMCERSGYSIVHGLHNDTTGSGRGAAALLTKMSISIPSI